MGRGVTSCEGTFGTGAVADAPPAIAKDTPAAPNTGKDFRTRFRFEVCFACAIVEISMSARKCSTNGTVPVAQIPLLMPITIYWFQSRKARSQRLALLAFGSARGPQSKRLAHASPTRNLMEWAVA
jgi:hypothetical protein